MLRHLSFATLFLLAAGCEVASTPTEENEDEVSLASQTASAPKVEEQKDEGAHVVPSYCETAPAAGDERALVCHRWTCDRDVKTAVPWNGDANKCSAGTIDGASGERGLRLVNTYRFLAGVPEVKVEPRWEQAAQTCALMAHANNKLDHYPPRSWACWSDLGAKASGVSLVANRSSSIAVDAYIEDPGNESTMVHRRWLLGTDITRIAFGSTNKYSCITLDARSFIKDVSSKVEEVTEKVALKKSTAKDVIDFVAWPPEGLVPVDALRATKVDTMGWTVQSSKLDLDGSKVEVSVGGATKKVKIHALKAGDGSRSAIRFIPDGWTVEANKDYLVRVTKGKTVSLSFTVKPTDC